jgi:hypothetical protein
LSRFALFVALVAVAAGCGGGGAGPQAESTGQKARADADKFIALLKRLRSRLAQAVAYWEAHDQESFFKLQPTFVALIEDAQRAGERLAPDCGM